VNAGRVASYVVGFGLHVAVGWLYMSAGLVVPPPFLFVLWAAWGAFLVTAILRRRPLYVLATPFLAVGFWIVFVLGLGTLLDWRP
jgi:hypothetical protein